ncbi:MAG: hypothetical protein M3P29_04460 [Acidobacteriota bacterium]|nr:hypothetical protein [Acidobacteriota bacterium]
MYECNKCKAFGLRFERAYRPEEAIEGNRKAKVWIIGLNPALDPDWIDTRTVEHLQQYFDEPNAIHSYFHDFKKVSRLLFDQFGKSGGTAHTDLVKCSNKGWPPAETTRKGRDTIVRNCEVYLLDQLRQFKPAMIVCNGSDVSSAIKRLLPPVGSATAELETSYFAEIDGHRICVVLAGFIGRIDNYAKRRLGREIETRLAKLGLDT